MPDWFRALEAQLPDVDLHVGFSFTPGADKTGDLIFQKTEERRYPVSTLTFSGGAEGNTHDWTTADRVKTVADKRNDLLELARTVKPDYYLSLDSDVLVPVGGLRALIENIALDGFDAVCPRVWVWNAFYVAGKYQSGRLAFLGRRDYGVQAVDVVTSSACLMSPKVYEEKAIRYGVAVRGKDFGWAPGSEVNGWNASECVAWSKAAKSKSMKLAANCNLTFEHRMKNEA